MKTIKNIAFSLVLCGVIAVASSFVMHSEAEASSVIESGITSDSAVEAASSSSYDIAEIYKEVRVDDGAKVIDSHGELKDVKNLLVPSRLDRGKYTIKVTRIESNIYQICDTDYYILTRYCYKYATREEVVVNITSTYGYSKGEIIFF